jgi:sarcosine oxidase
MPSYDIIIAGLGAMGSATAYQLAKRGCRVLGLDRFTPPHSFGSSHGQTRIIREAYFEHPIYVPMVQRAYALWEELARAASDELFRQTGGLMLGRADSEVFMGAQRSAETHRLPCEILDATQVRQRFRALRPDDDMFAVWEPHAGILFTERCIAAHLSLAARHGASLRYDEPVLRWAASGDGVKVVTAKQEYEAGQLILSAGSWLPQLAPELKPAFTIERQVLFWFDPKASRDAFAPERCPIHLWQFDGTCFFYGFPDLGEGVKVACHHDGEPTSPEQVRRDVAPAEVEAMRSVVRRFLPDADGPLRSATVCLYTNTADGHFWIDRLPRCPQVWIVSPCSGHGFKFSSVVGEVVADLATQGRCAFDLSLFGNRRADGKPGTP